MSSAPPSPPDWQNAMRFSRIITGFLDSDVWTDGLFSQPIMAVNREAAVAKMAEILSGRGMIAGDGTHVRLYDGFDIVAEVSLPGTAA